MLSKKTKKVSRLRGTRTHGGGHMKKRRGAGHRGGVGNAGSGKGADSKNQRFLKLYGKAYHGKRGFHSVRKVETTVYSIAKLETNFDFMVEDKIIEKEGSDYVFDTLKFGFDKVLGNGKFTRKLNIVVKTISKTAQEKIEKAGGKVIFKK